VPAVAFPCIPKESTAIFEESLFKYAFICVCQGAFIAAELDISDTYPVFEAERMEKYILAPLNIELEDNAAVLNVKLSAPPWFFGAMDCAICAQDENCAEEMAVLE